MFNTDFWSPVESNYFFGNYFSSFTGNACLMRLGKGRPLQQGWGAAPQCELREPLCLRSGCVPGKHGADHATGRFFPGAAPEELASVAKAGLTGADDFAALKAAPGGWAKHAPPGTWAASLLHMRAPGWPGV